MRICPQVTSVASILATVSAFGAPSALAWQIGTCDGQFFHWAQEDQPVHFRSTPWTPPGPWLNIQDAIHAWNNTPAALVLDPAIQIGTEGDPLGINTVVGQDNGHNEIWAAIDPELFDDGMGGQYGAVGFSWGPCAENDEGDVIFNAAFDYTVSTDKNDLTIYGGDFASVQAVAVHELGHAIGLGHEADEYNVMGDGIKHGNTNGDEFSFYPGEDATDAVIASHGVSGIHFPDAGVTHWKRVGSNGEYSAHGRTQLFDSSGDLLPSSDAGAEGSRYIVEAGQEVGAEFTYENNSIGQLEDLAIGFYLSDDNLITTNDRKIGSASRDLTRNDVVTEIIEVTIPGDVVNGSYWLGVIVDDDDAVKEDNETNNATATAISVAAGLDITGGGNVMGQTLPVALSKRLLSPTTAPADLNEFVTFRIEIVNTGSERISHLPLEDFFDPHYLRFHRVTVPVSVAGDVTSPPRAGGSPQSPPAVPAVANLGPDAVVDGHLLWRGLEERVGALGQGQTLTFDLHFRVIACPPQLHRNRLPDPDTFTNAARIIGAQTGTARVLPTLLANADLTIACTFGAAGNLSDECDSCSGGANESCKPRHPHEQCE
jgi:hypothetical protein